MRRLCVLLLAALAFAGCEQEAAVTDEGGADVILTIAWQRMVTDEGETCNRCGGTQTELGKAVQALRESLEPLGIEVAATETALTTEECASDIMQSNEIVIGGRALGDWLSGVVGSSVCGSCCGAIGEEVECRTLTVDGRTYEVIPAELIVRAGLVAASELVRAPQGAPCCPGEEEPCGPSAPCCPGEKCEDDCAT